MRELDRAEATLESLKSAPDWLSMRIGTFYARAGAVDRADRILRNVSDRVDRNSRQETSRLHLLEGELALAQGRISKAVETLSLADREASTPETLASLANACDRSGHSQQALEYYRRLVERASSSLGWEPQQSRIAAHVRLAEIYLLQGEGAKAASALEVIVRLWKNADPDLPLASKIARLQSRLAYGSIMGLGINRGKSTYHHFSEVGEKGISTYLQ